MKVSRDGKLEDPRLEGGKKIIEKIYAILCREWLPVMKKEFDSEEGIEIFSISIFGCLLLGNPTKQELADILYSKEIEKSKLKPSHSRCESIAEKLMLLKPRVDQNANYTDDPNLK